MCGDGFIQEGVEECDDSNQVNTDRCTNDCDLGYCGDGIVRTGHEICDDGNNIDGDGCDSNCTTTSCGNGILNAGEECDDGNDIDGDDCDSNCTLTACGNGVVTDGEECEDGNNADGDGCDSNCTLTACGNRIQTEGELCDDGNDVEGDGCDTNCTPSACGNGIRSELEECDDGNLADGDGCDNNCTMTGCGNGVLTDNEVCDDGNNVDGDDCDSNCTLTACGNGIRTAGEECDDGNDIDGDGCDSDCVQGRPCGANCPRIEYVEISGGVYSMGTRIGRAIEMPAHDVEVGTFLMARAEVTVQQYAECVDAGACTPPSTVENNPTCNWGAEGREDHPVNCVSWTQAKTFAAWVDGRLPTEAEWEYTARSQGEDFEYPWGNAQATCDFAIMKNAAGVNGCGEGTTAPVCSRPNGDTLQGVCDMAGNVFEWVEDDDHSNYFGAPDDGSAWVDEPRGNRRVYRGGAFYFNAPFLRSRDRRSYTPDFRVNYLGFRLARTIPD